MAPRLQHGDLAFIDQREQELGSRSAYAFIDIDSQLLLERALVLTSAAPDFSSEMRSPGATSQMTIVGRVVWSARDWT